MPGFSRLSVRCFVRPQNHFRLGKYRKVDERIQEQRWLADTRDAPIVLMMKMKMSTRKSKSDIELHKVRRSVNFRFFAIEIIFEQTKISAFDLIHLLLHLYVQPSHLTVTDTSTQSRLTDGGWSGAEIMSPNKEEWDIIIGADTIGVSVRGLALRMSESELLLVTRSNGNHSPGPVMREVSP